MAQLNLEWVDRLPGDEAETHIAVAFFMVQLYGKDVATAVQNDPDNRYLPRRSAAVDWFQARHLIPRCTIW